MNDKIVLCIANSYAKKYYFNDEFNTLPEDTKKEIQIMCVTYTEEIGGLLTMEFDEDGNLELIVTAEETDLLFDEIGSVLKIKQLRQQKAEMLEALELYFKVFYLGEDFEEL